MNQDPHYVGNTYVKKKKKKVAKCEKWLSLGVYL